MYLDIYTVYLLPGIYLDIYTLYLLLTELHRVSTFRDMSIYCPGYIKISTQCIYLVLTMTTGPEPV